MRDHQSYQSRLKSSEVSAVLPSGHTGVAFALLGVILFADRRHGWWALLAAAAIAWSRIYSSAHHLSDVMVAAFLGLVTASFVWERIEPRVDRHLRKYF